MDRRAALWLVFLLVGCERKAPLLEDLNLTHHEDLSRFTLQSARGLRDGDHLTVQLRIGKSYSMLTVNLRFVVGAPTHLESGNWEWSSTPGGISQGTVTARSVTFLGGQDGPPSIGGTFDLSGPGSLYRLTLPLTVLPRPFRPAASSR